MANPADDRLVQKLEDKLADAEDVKEQMMQFYQIRRSHEESLKSVVSDLIKKGILENVPPHFHYLSLGTSTGAIELFFIRLGAILMICQIFLVILQVLA
ncbi:MAG: hypothetical protein CM15mP51_19160 [Porticoccaceae bacterium]|nr:MAG: hypothetical protein CM15mP51_19160 [Porticoccaceae bacterium]